MRRLEHHFTAPPGDQDREAFMWFSRHDPEYASLGTEMRVLLATGSGGFDRVGGPGALGESINTIPSLIDDCPTCSALP